MLRELFKLGAEVAGHVVEKAITSGSGSSSYGEHAHRHHVPVGTVTPFDNALYNATSDVVNAAKGAAGAAKEIVKDSIKSVLGR